MAIQCRVGASFDQPAGDLALLCFSLDIGHDGLSSRRFLKDAGKMNGLRIGAPVLEKSCHGVLGVGIVGSVAGLGEDSAQRRRGGGDATG